MPDAIQFYEGHQMLYTYSAAGAKLKVVDKTAPDGVTMPVSDLNTILSNPSVASTTTTDYVGNYIYNTDNSGTRSLSMILLPEGYWQGGHYHYYLKDHLGSNRVVLRDDNSILERNHYYPSGARFKESIETGGSIQPYRHTGHEMQAMHGLNWIDNGARFRTVSEGDGFLGVDPLCEIYYNMSPYAYCSNNPIVLIDPNGLTDYNVNSNGDIYVKPDKEIETEYGFTIKIYSDKLPESKPGESDSFFAVDDKGNATGASYTVEDGVQKTAFDGNGFHADKLTVSNNKDGKGLFEFMADNTKVEWSQFKLDNGSNILSSSHDEYTELSAPSIAQSIVQNGGTIKEYTHSHPLGNLTDMDKITTPSGTYNFDNKSGTKDLGILGWMYQYNNNSSIKAYIYVPLYGAYYQYNLKGTFKATIKTLKTK